MIRRREYNFIGAIPKGWTMTEIAIPVGMNGKKVDVHRVEAIMHESGLCAHVPPNKGTFKRWNKGVNVSHAASGLKILNARTKALAIRAIKELASDLDWSIAPEALRADERYKAAVERVIPLADGHQGW